MNAQEKANQRYENLCAQYADVGFKIDNLVKHRRTLKQQIDTLNDSVPFLLQTEFDAKTQAAPQPVQIPVGVPDAITGEATPKSIGKRNEPLPNGRL